MEQYEVIVLMIPSLNDVIAPLITIEQSPSLIFSAIENHYSTYLMLNFQNSLSIYDTKYKIRLQQCHL
jgi:hypothetical protein